MGIDLLPVTLEKNKNIQNKLSNLVTLDVLSNEFFYYP